jgi:hypothetical protein
MSFTFWLQEPALKNIFQQQNFQEKISKSSGSAILMLTCERNSSIFNVIARIARLTRIKIIGTKFTPYTN